MKIDIIAEDAKGHDILIGLIRPTTLTEVEAISLLADLAVLRETQFPVRYGLVGDLRELRITDFEQPVASGFNCVLNTVDVLSRYDPEFGDKTIFRRYLTTLVEGWMRDVAYRWNSKEPPALDVISRIGLAQALDDGDTRSEVLIETDSVY